MKYLVIIEKVFISSLLFIEEAAYLISALLLQIINQQTLNASQIILKDPADNKIKGGNYERAAEKNRNGIYPRHLSGRNSHVFNL